MISYKDIQSRYPWCTLIAYHMDGDYHYAVWLCVNKPVCALPMD